MQTPPRIKRDSLLAGARRAEGTTVIIDVLRAFTSAACMLHLGAEKISLVAEPEEVLELKRVAGYLAVGEVDGIPVPGFDLGNSPSQILDAGQELFCGCSVALRTSAGVTGAVAAAPGSDRVLLGSYVTARASAEFIKALSPGPATVSLVAMGDGARETTPDDERCADYIEHLLTGRDYDHPAALREIVKHRCTQKFLRGTMAHYPPADPVYCLQRDLYDFAIIASPDQGQLIARRARRRKDVER